MAAQVDTIRPSQGDGEGHDGHTTGPRRRGRGKYDRSLSTEERHGRQRRAIVMGLAQLLDTAGPLGVSVSAVLSHALISRATFYQHFADTAAVVSALEQLAEQKLVQPVARATRDAVTPVSTLRAQCQAWFDALQSEPLLARSTLTQRYGGHLGGRVVKALAQALNPTLQSAHLARAVARRPNEVHLDLAAQVLFVLGLASAPSEPAAANDPDERTALAVDLILRLLR